MFTGLRINAEFPAKRNDLLLLHVDGKVHRYRVTELVLNGEKVKEYRLRLENNPKHQRHAV